MALSPLHRYRILIADADVHLSKVLKTMLESMGFNNITLTKSGADALEILKTSPFDFMITEWDLDHIGGLELISRVRREKKISDPSLPIIMLTGRAEQSDVMTARNYGMNEYVLKPFTAKSVYSRLERLIESPRNFVVSPHFVGPDRRFKGVPPAGISDRRVMSVATVQRPEKLLTEINENTTAHIWAADTALKKKLGAGTSLSSLITPAAVDCAQAAIAAISSESLLWIQENLNQLVSLYDVMMAGESYTLLPANMSDVALTISSRAGTFGFTGAAKVAYMLHKFCLNILRTEKKLHQVITQQHLDALKVTLSNSMQHKEPSAANEALIAELKKLSDKLTS